MQNIWTKEEKARLLGLYQALPLDKRGRKNGLKTLAEHFPKRSFRAIKSAALMIADVGLNRVGRAQYIPWTQEEDSLLRQLYATAPWKLRDKIRELFPYRSVPSVTQRADTLGIARSEMPEIPFTLSDTEAAFMAGLILGDGHITCTKPPSRTKRSCQIGFTNTEKTLVDWFKRVPRGSVSAEDRRNKDTDHPIKYKRICYRWCCHDKATVRQLVKYLRPYMIGDKKAKLERIAVELGVT